MKTSSNIDVRRMTWADIEAVEEIGRACNQVFGSDDWFADAAEDGTPLAAWVADYYGAPGAVCRMVRKPPSYRIDVFAVHPQLIGHGIGDRLIEHLKGRLYGELRHLDLCVAADDEGSADWLRALGFRAAGLDLSDRRTFLYRFTRPEL